MINLAATVNVLRTPFYKFFKFQIPNSNFICIFAATFLVADRGVGDMWNTETERNRSGDTLKFRN